MKISICWFGVTRWEVESAVSDATRSVRRVEFGANAGYVWRVIGGW